MYEYRKTLEKKFASVEFKIFPMDYHTWGSTEKGGLAGLPKFKIRKNSGVYLGH